MVNPLDLPGPQFLVFYVLLALLTLTMLYVVRSATESGPPPRIDTGDPYLIAYLRGGTNEALRIATVSLIDRGLLQADTATRTVVANARAAKPQVRIERVLLEHFEQPHLANTIFGNPALAESCADYERRLAGLGLLPDRNRRAVRRRLLLAALVVLVGFSVAKIFVAFTRGRTNVLFLVVLTIVASLIALAVATPRLTTRGRSLLGDLRRLFARLRERAPRVMPGGASADAALLAAVFGVAALPPAFAYAHSLYPRASSSSSSGSSCGASCGSSCGGGGNGGGCGGCGGGGGD